MRKLIELQKPYLSPIDLKVKFDPIISMTGCRLTRDECIELKSQIDKLIYEYDFTRDYFETHKDNESMLRKFIEENQ